MSNKKPIYKQWWFWVIIGVVVLALISSIGKKMMPSPEEAESYLSALSDMVTTTEPEPDQETTEVQITSTTAATPTESAEQTNASDDQREDLQAAFADAMGGALVTFSKTVRNDVTGNWRLAKLASSEDIVDHAVEYYKAYISDDSEVHFVINFTLNTTSRFNVYGDQIFIDEYARVDGEEHDAKMIPAGVLLKSYIVTISTGAIEDITDSE